MLAQMRICKKGEQKLESRRDILFVIYFKLAAQMSARPMV